MLTATCHCGAVRVEIPRRPRSLTHWEATQPTANSRIGVNARNFEPSALGAVRIRRLGGAATWKYLD